MVISYWSLKRGEPIPPQIRKEIKEPFVRQRYFDDHYPPIYEDEDFHDRHGRPIRPSGDTVELVKLQNDLFLKLLNQRNKHAIPLTPPAIHKLIHDLYVKAGLVQAKPSGRRYDLRAHSIRKFFRTQMAALGVDRDYKIQGF